MVVPKGWSLKAIKDIAPFQRGFDLPNRDISTGKYPVVFSNGVGAFHSDYMVKGPGIVTGRSGTIGSLTYVNENYWPHNTTLWVTDFCGNHPKFIYFLYQTLNWQLYKSGSGVPTLNRNDVHDTRVMVPDNISEQTAIAEALSDADSLITSLKKLIAKKKAIKQGAMQELLTGKKRLPGFRGEWKSAQLKECCEIQNGDRGINYPANEDFVPIGIPFINAGHLQNGKVALNDMDYITFKKYSLMGGAKLKRNDILFCLRGSLGKYAIYESDEGALASSLASIRCDETYIRYIYLYQLLGSSIFQQYIETENNGSSQPNLSAGSLRDFKIYLPTLDEQTAIATILSDMDAEIEQLEKKLAKYRHIKQGMMQELLTGRIRLVANESETTPVDEKTDIKPSTSHNESFQDAVILVALVNAFGSEQYPFTAFDCQKFPYLLHRHLDGVTKGYGEFAAGPYNFAQKYKTARPIALKKKYIKEHIGNYKGFVTDDNAQEALTYFSKWYGEEPLKWMEQFRRIPKRKDELELLTTVDMAMVKLREKAVPVTTLSVKQYIHQSKEWKAKLNRELFSDDNIGRAIEWSNKLFG